MNHAPADAIVSLTAVELSSGAKLVIKSVAAKQRSRA